jgi:hypothetical protein
MRRLPHRLRIVAVIDAVDQAVHRAEGYVTTVQAMGHLLRRRQRHEELHPPDCARADERIADQPDRLPSPQQQLLCGLRSCICVRLHGFCDSKRFGQYFVALAVDRYRQPGVAIGVIRASKKFAGRKSGVICR